MRIVSAFLDNNLKSNNFSYVLVSLALVVYPIIVLFIPKLNGFIYGVLSIAGLFYLFKFRKESGQINKDEIWFYFSVSLFFIFALFITIYAGFVYKIIGKYLHILFVIPVYIYLRQTGIKLFSVWIGLVMGSVVTLGVAIYDVYILNVFRAHGLTNPIIFGNISLTMGCMSMAGIGWFRRRASWQVAFPILAFICGIFASILSGTRGGWLTLPFLIILLFWYKKSQFSFWHKASILIIISVFASALYFIPQTRVSYHVDRTIKSLQEYSKVDVLSDKRISPSAERLEMWRASWKIYLENPILGVGWGHYQEQARLQVEQGLRHKSVAAYDHSHNEYLFAMVSSGSLGLIVLLQLFLIPAWLFIKFVKNAQSEDIKRLALAGLILIVCYMGFGLTEPMLYRSRSVGFFAFYLAVFMAAIYGQEKDEVVSLN